MRVRLLRAGTFPAAPRGAAAGGIDKTIRLWDLQALAEEPFYKPIVLLGHERSVQSVAFSSDGQTLASGSGDRVVRLWDLRALSEDPNSEPTVLVGHDYGINFVSFSPNSQMLASASSDGTIRIWPTLGRLVELSCQQASRNLTWSEWQQYFPAFSYEQTCPNLPLHRSVPDSERP